MTLIKEKEKMNIYYLTTEAWEEFNQLDSSSDESILPNTYLVNNDELLKLSTPSTIVLGSNNTRKGLYNGYPLYKVLFRKGPARDLGWMYIRAYLKVNKNGLNSVIMLFSKKQVFLKYHNGFKDQGVSNILPPFRIWAGPTDHPDWERVNAGVMRWFNKQRTHHAFFTAMRIALNKI